MRIARATRILGAAAALAAVAGAEANWYSIVNGPTDWMARFTKVPDFDQVRAALPNDGRAYCVPTSAINWAAYVAHHGHPNIGPGDATQVEWHSQSHYAGATSVLSVMGFAMSTDPNNGTSSNNAMPALANWFSGNFIIVSKWIGSGSGPDFDEIAQWIRNGVPVMGCVGWYSDNGTSIVRDNGHCFSVVKVERTGEQRFLTIHDPANEQDNRLTNSPPMEQTYEIETRIRFIGGTPVIIDKVLGYGSGYLDRYYAIIPLGGLSTSTDGTHILKLKPGVFSDDDDPLISEVLAPGLVQSLANAPFAPWSVVTTGPVVGGPPSKLWKYDDIEGFTELAQYTDATKTAFDRFGRLYLLDGRTIRCLNVDGETPVEEGNVVPGQPVEALAYDDVHDQLLALLADGSVQPYENGLTALAPVVLPPEILLGGDMLLATSPMDGSWFISSENSPGVYHFFPPEEIRNAGGWELIGDGVLDVPTGLSVGDDDCLFVTDSTDQAKVFCFDAEAMAWMQDTMHPLAGQPIGQGVQLRRSRTNFDPAIHDGPEFNMSVLPTEFAPAQPSPCFADLNDDLVIDGADLGLLLGAWGENLGDLNGDGTTDGADLGLLLGAWGDCTL